MYTDYVKTAIFSIFAYLFTLALVRLVGRKTVSQMTLFDFILGVSLGTITATIAQGPNRNTAVVTLVVFIGATIFLDFLNIGSLTLRKLINSGPITVMDGGQIITENLRQARLSLNELNMLLREKGFFSLSDVECAVMETDGKLSVLPKSQKQPVTPSDLGLSTEYKGLSQDIILDGTVLYDNLLRAGLDENWLIGVLEHRGIQDFDSVFYAGLDTAGNLFVAPKTRAH